MRQCPLRCLALALGLALHAPAWAQGAAEYYEQALVAFNLGEIRTAQIQVKNALKEDPFLLAAHILLAKTHLAQGDGAEAQKELAIAGDLGAHRSLLLIPLARAYLLQDKAEQLIAEILPLGASPEDDAELLTLRGQANLNLGRAWDAERAFDQALEQAPTFVPALCGRAQLRYMQGSLDAALADARLAVELDPRNAQARFLKAMIERDLGNAQLALADFAAAAEAQPAHLPAQIGRVGVLLALDRPEEAAAVVAKVRETYPRDPRVLYLEAVVADRRGDATTTERALQEAWDLLGQLPPKLVEDRSSTLLLAGMVSFSLKKWRQATDYLDAYSQRHPEDVGPRKLLAQLLLDRDRYDGAIALLESSLQYAPADPSLLSLLAEAYMREGQHPKASQLLEQAIAIKADEVTVRTQQAVNTFFLGRRREAIAQLEAIFSASPDRDRVGATLVGMLMQQQQFGQAARVAGEMVGRRPDNLFYLNLRGAAQFAHGDLASARASFLDALARDPSFLPARLNLVKLDLAEGKAADAQKRTEALLEEHPNHAGVMLDLARAREAQGDDQGALQWARKALGAAPGATGVSVYLTDLLLKTKQVEEALRIAENIELRAPDDLDVVAALGRAYLASGRGSTAQVVLQRASGQAGYDARLLWWVAALQQEAGDTDGALWSLQKAADGEPDFLPTRIRLGEALAAIGRTEKARQVAQSLQQDFPDAPAGYHLMGAIEQGAGEHEAALASYRAALQREPSPLLAVRLYEAQRRVDGEEAAAAFLQDWLREHPQAAIARQALADGYFRIGRWDEAQALFEQALAEAPDNPVLLNNLALVYVRQYPPRALEYAQRAYDLLPGVPDVGDTLGWTLVRNGRHTEGLKYLRVAQSRAPGNPSIGYHIAVALSELDRKEEAEAAIETTLRGDAPFAERRDAEALFASLRGARGHSIP